VLKKGVKEVRDHFTEYLKRIRRGEEIVITERGKPVALLRPIPERNSLQERLELGSIKGLIRLPQKTKNIPFHKKIKLTGKSLTDIVLEERETGW